jgi:prepilin-type N-terminal cleavage/methylation domain-containing protein
VVTDTSLTVPNRRDDGGFTLIELLIVVVIMGVLMATLASVITVALRTTPSTEARVDDARGLQGLVTWLPQDVDAAPPDGFDRDPAAWPCAAPAPADSHNVLTVAWTEQTTTATTYAASYRYELGGSDWTMARYFCTNGGTPGRINLTSALPAWDSADPPTEVVMCAVVVDAGAVYDGTCPAADTYPATELSPSPVRSLKLTVTLANGLNVTIDAAPKNPDASLADDPNATANQPPTVENTTITLTLDPSETAVFDLASYFGAVNDPDGDETRLTVSIDPTEPMPTNLVSASTAYNGAIQFELALTAGPVPGTPYPPVPLMLIVSDERGGWVVVQATIVVADPPNMAPWLESPDPDTRVVGIPADEDTTLLTIPQLFNVLDDQPVDQLGVTITGLSVTDAPTAVDTTKFVLTPSGGVLVVDFLGGFQPSAGGEIYVDLLVADADGAGLAVHLTIQVLDHQEVNDAPIATTGNVDVTIEAGQSVEIDVVDAAAHGVYDIDIGDDLTAWIVSSPSEITATTADTGVSLAVSSSAAAGVAAPVVIRVSDLLGAYVDVTVIVTITEPPVPPSDCVLGTLTATPNPVARQGGGVTARELVQDVTVTLVYTGTCDGLRLKYNSGDPTGLGSGVGRVFPPGSPSSIVIVGHFSGGTEKFLPANHVLTASTSSVVTTNTVTTTLTVS